MFLIRESFSLWQTNVAFEKEDSARKEDWGGLLKSCVGFGKMEKSVAEEE